MDRMEGVCWGVNGFSCVLGCVRIWKMYPLSHLGEWGHEEAKIKKIKKRKCKRGWIKGETGSKSLTIYKCMLEGEEGKKGT
jgi:hypothetical protein